MEQRIYHGTLTPNDIARALVAKFNRGNLQVQQIGSGKQIVVQIATRWNAQSGGQTALAVTLQQAEDGVVVMVGKQSWLGVAASLGTTAFALIRHPLNILGRLDDIAQDIENLQISEDIWNSIEEAARAAGATFELSERLRRNVCVYCETANPIGEPSCIACGAPLGSIQPRTCKKCGFIVHKEETTCPNCGQVIQW